MAAARAYGLERLRARPVDARCLRCQRPIEPPRRRDAEAVRARCAGWAFTAPPRLASLSRF
jgi:hypothetical protein